MSDVSIDILVNDQGAGCLVTDRKPAKTVTHVEYHHPSRRMAIAFEDGTKFPLEHKLADEIAERVLKLQKIAIISIKDDKPDWGTEVEMKML